MDTPSIPSSDPSPVPPAAAASVATPVFAVPPARDPGAPPPSSPAPASVPPPPVLPPRPPAGGPARPSEPSGRGWKIFALVLVVVLLLSLAGTVVGWVRGWMHEGHFVHDPSSRFEELVLEDNNAAQKLAVVDVEGIIVGSLLDGGGLNLVESVRGQLKRIEQDDAVKAVVLRIDSPGGEVLAADEIYRMLDEFQRRTGTPVVASMGGVAASGGYYVAAPCRWIVANELTITGSIGVIMHGYNYRGLMNKVGVRPEVYKSGKFKDMLSPDKAEEDILPEERKMVQGLVDETFLRFKKIVAEGRQKSNQLSAGEGQTLAQDWDQYADGRVLSGKQAHSLGFVDELGDFRTAVKRAKTLARLDKANLIRYEAPFELGNLLRLFGKSEARSIKLDLGLDFPPLQAGRLYYLFLPGVH